MVKVNLRAIFNGSMHHSYLAMLCLQVRIGLRAKLMPQVIEFHLQGNGISRVNDILYVFEIISSFSWVRSLKALTMPFGMPSLSRSSKVKSESSTTSWRNPAIFLRLCVPSVLQSADGESRDVRHGPVVPHERQSRYGELCLLHS